jgi:uncharacterized protein (DUF58 family)
VIGLGRSSIAVRRAGATALAGLSVLLVALVFDAGPLFVAGLGFTLMGLLAPVWVWGLTRRAHVERRLEQDRVSEGEPLEALVNVRGWLPGAELRDPLAGRVPLAPGRHAAMRVLARFERRGLRHLGPPYLLVRDPFALAAARLVGDSPAQTVLVLPRVEPVRWLRDGSGPDGAGSPTRAEMLAAVDVDGLRPYRHGAPASRIHWPALARGAGLLERRLRVDGDRTALVVLDARGAASEEHLDAAVRAAASLTVELARRGGCRLLLPGARRALRVEQDLLTWPLAHTRLALIESGSSARAPALGTVSSARGLVFYVAPRGLERLNLAFGEFGGEPGTSAGAVLVVPAQLARSQRASLEVAGCVGVPVRLGRRELLGQAA